MILIFIICFIIVCIFVINFLVFLPYKYSTNYKRDVHENFKDRNQSVTFYSGNRLLRGQIYGSANQKGLIVLAHGIGNSSDYYIPEILYFVDNGYKVFCFDYSCYWKNKGHFFKGFTQAVMDLRNAIVYIAKGNNLPITLIGHSLGGYAVCNVLNDITVPIDNVIAYAGFSDVREMLKEFCTRNLKYGKRLIYIMLYIVQKLLFGKKLDTTAVDGLNSKNVNALIIHGIEDQEIDVHGSAIYAKKKDILNANVQYILCTKKSLCSHMGIVRKDGTLNEMNEELLAKIMVWLSGTSTRNFISNQDK